jgi:hypothetical protein
MSDRRAEYAKPTVNGRPVHKESAVRALHKLSDVPQPAELENIEF